MVTATSNASKSNPGRERKRTEILRAAVEVFGAKGSTNGTLADIAVQVGMTHAGVLHHFGSKQELLLAVLAYRDKTDVADLPGKDVPDGPTLFLHLVRTAFANELRPVIVQVFTVLSGESVTEGHAGRAYFTGRYAKLRAKVSAAFRVLCAQEGVTDLSRINHGAASILAVMDGLQLQWLLDPTAVELAEASEFAIGAIVSATLAPTPPLADYCETQPAAGPPVAPHNNAARLAQPSAEPPVSTS